jgi:hypothetical protein
VQNLVELGTMAKRASDQVLIEVHFTKPSEDKPSPVGEFCFALLESNSAPSFAKSRCISLF